MVGAHDHLDSAAIGGVGVIDGAGGIAGEVIGALAETGTSKENAELYSEALRRGGTGHSGQFVSSGSEESPPAASHSGMRTRPELQNPRVTLAAPGCYRIAAPWIHNNPALSVRTIITVANGNALFTCDKFIVAAHRHVLRI